jgi:hypothetical protein
VENGIPCIYYGQIYTQYNLFLNHTISFISDEKAQKQKLKLAHGTKVIEVTPSTL